MEQALQLLNQMIIQSKENDKKDPELHHPISGEKIGDSWMTYHLAVLKERLEEINNKV